MNKLKTLFAAACAFVACSAFAAGTKTLSVNFVNSISSSDTTYGIFELKGKLWNDVAGGSHQTTSSLKVWDGASETLPSTASGLSLEYWCRGTWSCGSANKLLQNYLDESGSTAVTLKISNLKSEFSRYDLILYYATDNGGVKWNAPVVNGTSYTAASDGTVTVGEETWGSSTTGGSLNKETVEGVNAIRIKGLTADELSINTGKNNGSRGCLAALQIVNSSKGAEAQLKRTSSGYAIDVKIDKGAVSSADLTVRKKTSNGQTTESVLATGVTASGWVTYPLSGIDAAKSYEITLVVSSGSEVIGEIELGGICPSVLALSSAGTIDVNSDGVGTVTVTRGTDAESTAFPLVVNLAYSGTAVFDVDYTADLSVTIPAGASSASLEVKPLLNDAATADRTLVVSVANGAYPASSSTTTLSVLKPNWGWTMDTSAKTITERVESGTPWIINVGVSGSDLTLGSPKTVGTTTVLDFRKVIATTAGVKYKIVINADGAFMNKSTITEIYLPESMTTIYNSLCNNCANLTKVQVSSKLKKIGGYAFNECKNLRTVIPFLPDTVAEIGEQAFFNCYRLPLALRLGYGQTSAGAPLTITFGNRAFKLCKAIPSVDLGPGVTTLASETFSTCQALTEVTLSTGITSIGSSCFNSCTALETVTPFLPDSLTKLGDHVFYNCTSLKGELKVGQGGSFSASDADSGMFANSQVTSATIKNMEKISRGFFRGMKSLTSVSVDDTTTEIGINAFYECTALKSFTFPANVTTLREQCFCHCTALETVTPFLPETVTTIGPQAFYNCSSLKGDLSVGQAGPVTASDSGAGMFRYAQITSATIQNMARIPKGFLRDLPVLTSVSVDDTTTELGNDAFYNDPSLTAFELPPNLTKIGNDCFAACSSLKTVTPLLPETLTAIGSSAFSGCTSLEGELEYAVNQSSATLGACAFQYCYALTKVTIGDSITALPHDCFRDCKALKYVRYSPNLTSIDYNCFLSCTELCKVEPALLPLTITAVGESAFNNCKKLNQPVKFWPATEMTETKPRVFAGSDTKVGIPLIDVGVNVQKLGEEFVTDLDSLRYFVMRNPTLDWRSNTFNSWSEYQTALVIPRNRTTWSNGTSLENEDVMIPWASLSDDKKKKYTDLFPCDPEPRGLIADGNNYSKGTYPRHQWILSYGIVTEGVKNLMIDAQPSWYGAAAVSPSYGTHKNISVTVPMNVTSPSYVEEGGNVLYGNKGYVLEVSGDFGWENPVTNLFEEAAYGTTRTIAYTTDTDGDKRITWLWEPAAYTVAVLQPTDPNVGSVTLSKGSLGGYFKIGETATITANKGTGTFVKWHGDVPAGHEKDNPLQVTIDGPKNITPEFTQPWTFDSTAKTISDGYWEIRATRGSDGNYTISSPKTVPALAILDLAKGMASGDSGKITKIADSAFNNSQSRTLIEVRLPETLTTIGSSAFEGNTLLKTVTPFLPASVESIGPYAFKNCTSLESELFLAKDGGAVALNTNGETFRGTAIPEVTIGPDVTLVPNSCFYGCSKLKTVHLGKNLEQIYSSAFDCCSILETVDPFFPASVTNIKSYAFSSCTKLKGTAYIGTNGVDVTLGEGVFNYSGTEVIHLGEGVKMIPKNFCKENQQLKTLTMSESVTNIGETAFYNCSLLETVTPLLPANLAHMKHATFNNTPKLKCHVSIATNGIPVTFPSGAESWFNSSGITSIYIGEGLKNTPRYLCAYCNSLTNVVIANGVTNINQYAFLKCAALESVKLPDDLVSIGCEAFNACSALKTVTPFLPDTIRTIERHAFVDCTAIVSPLTLEAKKVKGVRPTIDLTTHTSGTHFWNCPKIPSLTVGEVSALKGQVFGHLKGVKNFYIKKKTPFEVSGSENFRSWTARQSRWFIPKTGWESWLETNVTPWADVSSDDKGDYHDAYPGAKDAYGMVKTSYQGLSGGQWVILWNPEPVGFTLILR